MKTFRVTLEFIGLTGKYTSIQTVRARDAGSARKKASQCIGDRTGDVILVEEVAS